MFGIINSFSYLLPAALGKPGASLNIGIKPPDFSRLLNLPVEHPNRTFTARNTPAIWQQKATL